MIICLLIVVYWKKINHDSSNYILFFNKDNIKKMETVGIKPTLLAQRTLDPSPSHSDKFPVILCI